MRVRDLALTYTALLELLAGMDGTALYECRGIPPGARVLGVRFDESCCVVLLRVESASFAEVPEGDYFPRDALEMTVRPLPQALPDAELEMVRERDRRGALLAQADRENLLAEVDRLRQADAHLRAIFADYLSDSEAARLAYERGWLDGLAKAEALRRAEVGRLRAQGGLSVEVSVPPPGASFVPPQDAIIGPGLIEPFVPPPGTVVELGPGDSFAPAPPPAVRAGEGPWAVGQSPADPAALEGRRVRVPDAASGWEEGVIEGALPQGCYVRLADRDLPWYGWHQVEVLPPQPPAPG